MRATLSLLVAFPALAVARNVVTIGMTGSWHSTNVTDDNTKLLGTALSGSSFSKAVGDTRVCYSEVASLETQVVAGTNYRFHINGCDVTDSDGECSATTLSSCKLSGFVVQIFEQTWTNTLKVTSIKTEEATTASSSSASASSSEETMVQSAVQQKEGGGRVIKANGFNQYGDAATRMYTGGTPLFDENTGKTKDRYDYIRSHHPDHPWQKTATLFAAETEVDETQGQGSVAAGVAILKMHQGRRDRFRYNPIHSREQ
ncbi:Proteinase inhibitor I25, cystatin, conserved site [Phytophthora cactorum]|nr:Proteinase inhibitor I25, cystatin, conserved site [Phytophthora cactorum]